MPTEAVQHGELVDSYNPYIDLLKVVNLPEETEIGDVGFELPENRVAAFKRLKENGYDLSRVGFNVSVVGKDQVERVIDEDKAEAAAFFEELRRLRELGVDERNSAIDSYKKALEPVIEEMVQGNSDVVEVNADLQAKEDTGSKEMGGDESLVWYDGILDDLKIVTYIDKEVSEDEKKARGRTFARLRGKGIILPRISWNSKDIEGLNNRQKVRSAVEFLRDPKLSEFKQQGITQVWNSRGEAVAYLKSLGIGDGKGKPYSPDSDEAKAVRAIEDEKKKYIWYDGIIDQLTKAFAPEPDSKNTTEEARLKWRQARDEAIVKLKEHEVPLPDFVPLEADEDQVKFRKGTERAKAYGALLALNNKHKWDGTERWGSREAALDYLKKELKVAWRGSEKVKEKVEAKQADPVDEPEKQGDNNKEQFPSLEGREVTTYTGMSHDLWFISNPRTRETNSFKIVRERLMKDAGIDVDKLIGAV